MKTLATRTAEYSCLEGNIFLCRMLPDAEVEVEDTQENLEAIQAISGRKPYAVLVDARVPVSISKEAMENAARPAFYTNLVAQAILVGSLANRLVGNFIIKFHKPSAPTRLFSDYGSALQWLREQMQKKKNSPAPGGARKKLFTV